MGSNHVALSHYHKGVGIMVLFQGISRYLLPSWISDIKNEARAKITGAKFAADCRSGNRAVMRGLIIGLWPFIDEFPISMIRVAARLSKSGLLNKRELLNTFLRRGPQLLVGIKRDEENHRKLWLRSGDSLGLKFPADYMCPVLAETQEWIDAINAEGEPFTLLLRFAAIEMIAEIVSVEFLASKAFTTVLGEEGCEWFRVHAEHEPGMTHEELELKLAFALSGDGDSMSETGKAVIQRVIDLGVAAMEAAAKLDQRSNSFLIGD